MAHFTGCSLPWCWRDAGQFVFVTDPAHVPDDATPFDIAAPNSATTTATAETTRLGLLEYSVWPGQRRAAVEARELWAIFGGWQAH
ncbi:hypothetical protein ACFWTC_34340 [Streptomyces sp. NPDC058619]|uniref:hypothetical protein n=1 Tax=unclassified Streptomyces TaxID=2593676 RepID=UPI003669BE81